MEKVEHIGNEGIEEPMVVREKARAAIRAEAWACNAQAAFHRVFLPNEALCSTTHGHPRTKVWANLIVPRGLLGEGDNRILTSTWAIFAVPVETNCGARGVPKTVSKLNLKG